MNSFNSFQNIINVNNNYNLNKASISTNVVPTSYNFNGINYWLYTYTNTTNSILFG